MILAASESNYIMVFILIPTRGGVGLALGWEAMSWRRDLLVHDGIRNVPAESETCEAPLSIQRLS